MVIWQYTYIICHIIWAQRPKMKRSDGVLIFYSKIKSFQYFQCLAANVSDVSVLSHVESLGNFKNKYKTKEEKVRNQTIHNKEEEERKKKKKRRRTYQTEKKKKEKKKKKRRGRRIDQQRRRRKKGKKKKKKQLLHDATLDSSSSSSFSPSLFSFLTNETFWPGIHLPAKTAGFCRYSQYAIGTAGIFSGTKQGGYLY